MNDGAYPGAQAAPTLNAGRLWAGGFATALVAGLVVLVGVFVARGIFDIQVLAPRGAGDSPTAYYVAGAVLTALLATALLHILLALAPRPLQFFGWIGGLATVVATFAPFVRDAGLDSKLATGVINLIVGLAVVTLLSGVAASALRPALRY